MKHFDEHEIQKFDDLAASFWDETGSFKTLHAINPLRVQWMNQFVNDWQRKPVLDVGCGGGLLSESMALLGAEVTAIDRAEQMLSVAKLHWLTHDEAIRHQRHLHYHLSDSSVWASKHAGHYQMVACMEMLEHVSEWQSVIDDCYALLAPGGWAFFSTLTRTWQSYIKAVLLAEYALKLLPKGTHDWQKMIRPYELRQAAEAAGFEVKALQGFDYSPFSNTAGFCSTIDCNYLMAVYKPK